MSGYNFTPEWCRAAADEIERLRADIDSVVLCRMCHKPDAACQCTHETTDSWMTVRETVAFMDDEVERLRAIVDRGVVSARERVGLRQDLFDAEREIEKLRAFIASLPCGCQDDYGEDGWRQPVRCKRCEVLAAKAAGGGDAK